MRYVRLGMVSEFKADVRRRCSSGEACGAMWRSGGRGGFVRVVELKKVDDVLADCVNLVYVVLVSDPDLDAEESRSGGDDGSAYGVLVASKLLSDLV